MNEEFVNPIHQLLAAESGAAKASSSEEWRAAREGCALFSAAHRSIVRATGEDAESFLHGMLTNDVKGLAVGGGQHAAFLTDTGKVVSDLRLYRDEEGFDLDCVSWRRDHLCAGLDKFIIADDIELEDDGARCALAYLEGPAVGETVSAAFQVAAPALDATQRGVLDGGSIALHGVSDVGGHGVLVVGPAALRDAAHRACEQAGALAAGLATLEILRVEAGTPWAGVDMSEDTLLMEIGLPDTISRTKGCYLGQEVVERVSARGQVNRTLTGFAIDADAAQLPDGALDVVAGDGKSVGTVSSRVWSHALDGLLGMGLLHRKGREASELRVVAGDASFPCRAIDFPARSAE